MKPPDQYPLGYRRAEQERLQQQALQLADEARWLFAQVGPLAGRVSSKSVVVRADASTFLPTLPGRTARL